MQINKQTRKRGMNVNETKENDDDDNNNNNDVVGFVYVL